MDKVKARRILLEQARRAKNQVALVSKVIKDTSSWLKARTHEKQYNFLNSVARFKAALTGRQAGKSKGVAKALVLEAVNYCNPTGEPADFSFVSLTRGSAKKIIWKDLLKVCKDDFRDEVKHIDNTILAITFKNGNTIYLCGAKDDRDIDKLRGARHRRVYIDEAQAFKDKLLKNLIEENIMMSLIANDGGIVLTGTPHSACSGYFYDVTTGKKVNKEGVSFWDIHKWNAYDNIYLKDPKAFLKEIYIDARGLTEDDSIYKREALGLWVRSDNYSLYKFNENINMIDLPVYDHTYIIKRDKPLEDVSYTGTRCTLPFSNNWTYVLGIDFGFSDECAWVVMAFNNDEQNKVYVVETLNKSGIIPSVAAEITKQMNAKYNFIKIVGDTGGLGKGYAEEMRQRYGIMIEKAEKTEKFSFINLMNDDFRTGKIKSFTGCDINDEWLKLQWEVVGVKVNDDQDNHLADAGLYAWRECRHYFYEKPADKLNPNSDEYWTQKEKELEEQIAKEIEKKTGSEWWEQ